MTEALAEAIKITPSNVDDYRDLHAEITAHLSELITLTLRYPVEIDFRGIRFVFESEHEVRLTLKLITQALGSHGSVVA